MVYTLLRISIVILIVPVSAHLPMVYTGDKYLPQNRCVPVSAHLPMVYTREPLHLVIAQVPVSAHLPMVYTSPTIWLGHP